MHRRRTYRINADPLEVLHVILIGAPDEFNTDSASLKGRYLHDATGKNYGQLPEAFIMFVSHASYVVWSYSTPIAWREINGSWVCPNHTYSVVTSKHQNKVRAALSQVRGGYRPV